MNELISILNKIKPGVDFTNEKGIIDNHLLESLDIIRLVAAISDEFDVDVEVTDMVPENFNSVEAMMAMIARLEEE